MLKFLHVGAFLTLILISLAGSMQVEAAHASTAVTVWLQVMDSCRQGLPGANFTLVTPNGSTINAGPSSGTSRKTVSSGGSCPLQRGNCQLVPVGCLSWTIIPPGSGTKLYMIHENSTFN
ncbi:MAG TPA: hypothetical protein VH593_11945, partial [Ktedonobacteraceae bacterium]